MPYESHWHIPNRVILTRLHGKLNGEDFGRVCHTHYEMTQAGTKPVHILLDLQDVTLTPGLNGIYQNLGGHDKSKWGWLVGITQSPRNTMLLRAVMQRFNVKIYIVPSLRDAEYLLKRMDDSLAEFTD